MHPVYASASSANVPPGLYGDMVRVLLAYPSYGEEERQVETLPLFLEIIGMCSIDAGGIAGFGTRPIASGNLSGVALGTLSVECPESVHYGVGMDAGLYFSGGQRRMSDGTHFIPYVLNAGKLYDSLSAGIYYRESNGREDKLSLQKSSPRGTGYGYVVSLSKREGALSTDMHTTYKNERGIYTAVARHSKNSGMTSGSVSIAGSLALLGGKLYQGRPIIDSFAVVHVKGLDRVTVENGNSAMGRTGSSGTLLVPDLSSYNKNRLSIAMPNLPLNYTAPVLAQEVEVEQRSGSLVEFEFTRFTAVEGNLYLPATDGRKIKLEALPVEIMVDGQKRDAFLGRDGYFYLEDIPVGEYSLRVRRFGGDCLARLDVPDSDEIIVDLGAVMCRQLD